VRTSQWPGLPRKALSDGGSTAKAALVEADFASEQLLEVVLLPELIEEAFAGGGMEMTHNV